jgi:hypothetical protein
MNDLPKLSPSWPPASTVILSTFGVMFRQSKSRRTDPRLPPDGQDRRTKLDAPLRLPRRIIGEAPKSASPPNCLHVLPTPCGAVGRAKFSASHVNQHTLRSPIQEHIEGPT